MNIDLNENEVRMLRNLLEQRREELWTEIRRTDTPSYHDELRAVERTVVALLGKLEQATKERPNA